MSGHARVTLSKNIWLLPSLLMIHCLSHTYTVRSYTERRHPPLSPRTFWPDTQTERCLTDTLGGCEASSRMELYVELGVFSTLIRHPSLLCKVVTVLATPKSIGWPCVKRLSWKIITGSRGTRTNRTRHLIWCKMITFFFFLSRY